MTADDINGLNLSNINIGIAVRLNLKLTNHKTAPKVRGFSGVELWPPDVPLRRWLPDKLKALADAADASKLSIDEPPPSVQQPLVGGPEFLKTGEILKTEASLINVRAYSYREPGVDDVIKYVRLCGDTLHCEKMDGELMFDETALRTIAADAATLALLDMPWEKRPKLGYKFLLPGVDGMYKIKVEQAWLIEEVQSVAPLAAAGAKWKLGVHNYFCMDHVVGAGGELLPCPPAPRALARGLELRLFVHGQRCASSARCPPSVRALPFFRLRAGTLPSFQLTCCAVLRRETKSVAQYAWQNKLVAHLVRGNGYSPINICMSPCPYDWWLVLTEGMEMVPVRGESWRLRV
eukprot:7380772-Prymnesium_polylepis.1